MSLSLGACPRDAALLAQSHGGPGPQGRGGPSSAQLPRGVSELEGSFLEPLEPRDSILIADQLRYGFVLQDVTEGTGLAMQDWSQAFGDTLIIVRNWKLDTLRTIGSKRSIDHSRTKNSDKALSRRKAGEELRYDISADVILAPFEAGKYVLPRIAVQRTLAGGLTDTLLFNPQEMLVTTIPVDTTIFQIHDIKGQVRYPLTFREVLPYLLGTVLIAAIIAAAVYYIRRYLRRRRGETEHRDPPYIVALRALEHYRGDRLWAPEKQKTFYSGITDTLREYMAETFGIDAREMTTAEIFSSLNGEARIPRELYIDTKDLFELADFVKFAKHTVTGDELAKAVPSAVRFVTSTYQAELDTDQPEPSAAAAGEPEMTDQPETNRLPDIDSRYAPSDQTASGKSSAPDQKTE